MTLSQSYFEDGRVTMYNNTEPVDRWKFWQISNGQYINVLDKYYQDPSFAMKFQILAATSLATRTVNNWTRAKEQRHKYFLSERSVNSTQIFSNLLLSEQRLTPLDYSIIESVRETANLAGDCVSNFDLVVYIRTEPSICLQRIVARGRAEESMIDLKYLQDLHNVYESKCTSVFMPNKCENMLILNGSHSIEYNVNRVKQKIANLESGIRPSRYHHHHPNLPETNHLHHLHREHRASLPSLSLETDEPSTSSLLSA